MYSRRLNGEGTQAAWWVPSLLRPGALLHLLEGPLPRAATLFAPQPGHARMPARRRLAASPSGLPEVIQAVALDDGPASPGARLGAGHWSPCGGDFLLLHVSTLHGHNGAEVENYQCLHGFR